MNERLVWIDCEMTGLDLKADALVEVAALVTDFDLNVIGEGIDVLIKPPQAALDQMIDFVRNMHVSSGLLEELEGGLTMADAEQQVLAYIKEHCPDGSRPPLGGNTVATDRSFLARDMPTLEGFLHYRNVDVSSIKELARRWYPRTYFAAPGQARQPPCAGRHPGEHRGAALLPRGRLRPAARPRQRRRARDRGQARGHDHRTGPRFRNRALIALHFSSALRLCAGAMVGIAQLVERRLVVADVAGSSPVTHPSGVEPLTAETWSGARLVQRPVTEVCA